MKIVVTGGAGRIGRYVVEDLLDAHHAVVVFDQAPLHGGRAEFVKGDVRDLSACTRVVRGADAIIHLAAIPGPMPGHETRVIETNVLGTHNVHEAAVAAGVPRVVTASSICAYGWPNMSRKFVPDYFPVDVAHPLRPQDHYGLSKLMCEEIAVSFTRRCGLETVVVRPTGVHLPDEIPQMREHADISKPNRDFWSYVDARDCARLFRLCAEVPGLQHETFLAVADDNIAGADSMDLLARHFPRVPVRKEIPGDSSLFDWTNARDVLGFQPSFSLRARRNGRHG